MMKSTPIPFLGDAMVGKHARTPVAVAIYRLGVPVDSVSAYGEVTCPKGAQGHLSGCDLMDVLLG